MPGGLGTRYHLVRAILSLRPLFGRPRASHKSIGLASGNDHNDCAVAACGILLRLLLAVEFFR